MHDYTKDAIVMAAQRCETAMQLAHIFEGHDRFAVAHYAGQAAQASKEAFKLARISVRARALFGDSSAGNSGQLAQIPTGDHWL